MLPDKPFKLLLENFYPPEKVETILHQLDSAQSSMTLETLVGELAAVECEPSLHLLVKDGAGQVRSCELGVGEHLIGRATECSIALDDLQVSRVHCLLTVHSDGRLTLRDLKSKNGILKNGQTFSSAGRHTVNPGDCLQMGRMTLTLVRL